MKWQQFGCAMALAVLHVAAAAQWVWTGPDGRKVFSDRPPPVDVPDKAIVKRPALQAAASSAPEAAASDSAAPPSPAASGGDKLLQERKKQAADAQAAKNKAEQQRTAQIQADNCARARKAKALYQSGVRIATTNAQGEREFMSDQSIAAEARHAQEVIEANCN